MVWLDASSPGDVLDVVRLVEDEHCAADADLARRTDHRVHQVAACNQQDILNSKAPHKHCAHRLRTYTSMHIVYAMLQREIAAP